MKKWLFAVFLLFVLGLSCFYLIIPSTLKISRHVVVDCSISAANRYLLEPSNWLKWWPGKQVSSQGFGAYQYRDFRYSIDKLLYNRVQLSGNKGQLNMQSFINTISFSKDTIAVEWQLQCGTSYNPLTRYRQYATAQEMGRNMQDVLSSLSAFLHNKDLVYGIKLQKILNGERSLLVIDSILPAAPSTPEVYGFIARLRKAVAAGGAKEINYPMLHLSRHDSTHFFMMVAVQTDVKLNRVGKIYYKHTYPGYTLLTQVRGGPSQIDRAIAQMHTYIQDYQIVSPAIPYAEMVTDRTKVPDTSQWITRVYYPVF